VGGLINKFSAKGVSMDHWINGSLVQWSPLEPLKNMSGWDTLSLFGWEFFFFFFESIIFVFLSVVFVFVFVMVGLLDLQIKIEVELSWIKRVSTLFEQSFKSVLVRWFVIFRCVLAVTKKCVVLHCNMLI